ncbi:unnamed protein product [Gulo gulo]|uniref:Uncharacterized protein n=1 Tax=Gulo gulo TaxID=48420 RepID=A0A9X9LTQ8_GULGU|nr:unnamed protein product [Gulo gulo]
MDSRGFKPPTTTCGHLLQQPQDPRDQGFLRATSKMGHSRRACEEGLVSEQVREKQRLLFRANPSNQAQEPCEGPCRMKGTHVPADSVVTDKPWGL